MTKQILEPLNIIKQKNGYKIRQYIKSTHLLPLADETRGQKLKRLFLYRITNPLYHSLSYSEKQLLHTIAPLWANILEHNMSGDLIVTDDHGNRYDLTSMNVRSCLVGEAYGFKNCGEKCDVCYGFNIDFASLNHVGYRWFDIDIKPFLNHYKKAHWGRI